MQTCVPVEKRSKKAQRAAAFAAEKFSAAQKFSAGTAYADGLRQWRFCKRYGCAERLRAVQRGADIVG